MLITPSNLIKNKITKNKTILFETPTRTQGNMVIIPGATREDIYSVLTSTLFRPTQLFCRVYP